MEKKLVTGDDILEYLASFGVTGKWVKLNEFIQDSFIYEAFPLKGILTDLTSSGFIHLDSEASSLGNRTAGVERDLSNTTCKVILKISGMDYVNRKRQSGHNPANGRNNSAVGSFDPVIDANRKWFENQFDIIEEDADVAPFDLPRQLYLSNYLNEVQKKITILSEGRPEDEKNELQELQSEAEAIRKVLTKETKREIIRRLAHFWGKAQKVGLDIIKEIFVSTMAELAKQLVSGK